MKRRLLESLRRLADAVSRRCTQKIDHADFVARYGRNGNHVGAATLFIALSLTACGPSRATRTAIDEVIVMDVRCATELDALHFEPGPNLDADARQQAVLAGCQERAFAFCAAHHITHADTEVCP